MNGAMSREAMLAGLQDIRLPPDAAGGLLSDVAVGIGLAAFAALVGVALLRAFGRERTTTRPPTLSERVTAINALPEEERRVALLHLLKDEAPDRYAPLGKGLYRPDSIPLSQIEAEVARLV